MENITQPAPKFVVGDRVRVVGDGKNDKSWEHFFKIGTIGEITDDGFYNTFCKQYVYEVTAPIFSNDNAHQWVGENDLEKVES